MSDASQILFSWLVASSLKGTVLIGLVLLLQWLSAGRIPPAWRHSIWLLVIIRLLLPQAPSSDWSVFNLPRMLDFEGGRSVDGSAVSPASIVPFDGLASVAPAVESSDGSGGKVALFAVWISGFVLIVSRALAGSYRLSRRLAAESPRRSDPAVEHLVRECRALLGVRKHVEVVESASVDSPALHRFRRPLLLVPPDLLSSFDLSELRYVVLHELAHVKRGDVVTNWLITLTSAIHWFNPLVWIASSRIREERELACDEIALTALAAEERSRYGETVLKLLNGFRTPILLPALVGMMNRKNQMKRRITMIANFKRRTRSSFLFLAVVAAFGLVTLTDASEMRIKKMSAEDQAVIERLEQKVSLEAKEVTVTTLLSTFSGATGVPISLDETLRTDVPLNSRKITLSAENVPASIALTESLESLDLHFEVEGNGLVVRKIDVTSGDVLFRRSASSADGGPVRRKIIKREGHPTGEPLDKILEREVGIVEGGKEKIMIRRRSKDAAADGGEKQIERLILLGPQVEKGVEGAPSAIRKEIRLKGASNEDGGTLSISIQP